MRKGRTSRKRRRNFKIKEDVKPAEPQTKNLLKWADSNGLNMHSCSFKAYIFPDTGRGMLARRRYKKNSMIISVPQNLLITTQYVMRSYIGDLIKKYTITRLKPIQLLCIFLMCEKHKDCNSFWHPYINSLPQTYTTPGYWNPDELSGLPVWIRDEALKQIQNIKDSFTELALLISKLTSVYPDLKPAISYNSYLWAWSTVNTRAVYMEQPPIPYLCGSTPDNMVLAPVLDFLNHSAHVEVKAGFNEQSRCYEIYTVTPCNKHQQLFINYGPHDNTKLLLEYGFVIPDNPHSAVIFSLNDCKQFAEKEKIKYKEQKVEIIEESNLYKNCICSLQGGISWNLQCAMKILTLDLQGLKHWRKVLYEPGEHQDTLLRSTFLMKSYLKAKLQLIIFPKYKESLNDLQEMITTLCEEQRHILEHCISTLS